MYLRGSFWPSQLASTPIHFLVFEVLADVLSRTRHFLCSPCVHPLRRLFRRRGELKKEFFVRACMVGVQHRVVCRFQETKEAALMGKGVAALVLFLCLEALVLTATAIRTHGNFSTSSYYSDNDTTTEVPIRGSQLPDSKQPTNGEQPKEEVSSEFTVKEDDPIQDRYPHGYYPDSQYTEGNPLPAKKTVDSTSYTVVDNDNATETNPTGTIPDRYPQGYYPGNSEVAKKSSSAVKYTTEVDKQQSVDPANERYPLGYYPNSQYTGTGQSVNPSSKAKSYSAKPLNQPEERYPHGYYPNSQYAGSQSSQSAVSKQSNAVQFSSQTRTEQVSNPAGERYAHGYYSGSQYSLTGPKPVTQGTSYSYQGDFNTLPYVNNAGELPFELSGAGCRAAYWIENVDKWPKFFNAKSTVEDAFGSKAKEVFGDMTILLGLMKYGTDPYSELLRSGCTAILNSYTRGAYGISHVQVIEEFNAALVSKDSAAAQALAFETANVESISSGNACT